MKSTTKDYLDLVGIAAVILSLLFVALEIRQSNRIAIADSETAFRTRVIELQSRVIENDELAAALVKLRNRDSEITPIENEKVYSWVLSSQTNWRSVEAAFRNGLVSEQTMNIVLATPRSVLGKYPGLEPYFRQIADDFGMTPDNSLIWQSIFRELNSSEIASE